MKKKLNFEKRVVNENKQKFLIFNFLNSQKIELELWYTAH